MTLAPKFRGSFDQKIDPKGRVSIPAAFRKIAEASDPGYAPPEKSKDSKGAAASIVIVFGDEARHYLECYSIIGMTQVEAMIEAMDYGSEERDLVEELYYAQSQPAEIDADGRIIMPQFMREKLKLDGEVKFIGMGDRFEVWKPETYQALKSGPNRTVEERFGPKFDRRSLLRGPRPA